MNRALIAAVVTGACVLAHNGSAYAANAATMGRYVDDSVITAKIKSALVADRGVNGFDIHIETRQGEVLLSGSVENQAQSDRAVDIIRKIDGVRKVDNRVRVQH
jgi:hyperosmotically inducible protein